MKKQVKVSSGTNYCLDTSDLDNNRIIFAEKRRQEKAKIHTELRDLSPSGFVKKNIPRALQDPDTIYEDLDDSRVRCYYKLEGYINTRHSRINFYTKIVVSIKANPWFIITAYQPQNVKEEKGGLKKCLYQKQ